MTRKSGLDRSVRPVPGSAPQIRLPRLNRFVLGNGLRVVAVKHDDMPEVSARLLLTFGSLEDDRERAGTALLTARALTEGTTRKSAGEVARALDYLGARFRIDVNHDIRRRARDDGRGRYRPRVRCFRSGSAS